MARRAELACHTICVSSLYLGLQIVLALRDGPELAIINLDAAEQADHRLRARRERPRRHAAMKRDELAPSHPDHRCFLSG
jgi:hypothetical protein